MDYTQYDTPSQIECAISTMWENCQAFRPSRAKLEMICAQILDFRDAKRRAVDGNFERVSEKFERDSLAP